MKEGREQTNEVLETWTVTILFRKSFKTLQESLKLLL